MPINKITDETYPVNYDPPPMVRGADWHWAFQFMEDDNVTPIDTTGYTCSMVIRESENGETYATLSIGSGITMTAASGLFNIDLDDSVVDAYDWRTAEYKLIVTDDSGGKTPLFVGRLRIQA
jgi:hypothetical protein